MQKPLTNLHITNISVKFKFDKVKFIGIAANLHRMAEVIWPPSSGCIEPCPDCFGKISKHRDCIQILPGQIVPALSHPQTIKKGCSLLFRGNPTCVSFCAHCLCHWAPLKTAWLHSLCVLPSGTSIHYHSPSLLFPGLNSLSSLSLSL